MMIKNNMNKMIPQQIIPANPLPPERDGDKAGPFAGAFTGALPLFRIVEIYASIVSEIPLP